MPKRVRSACIAYVFFRGLEAEVVVIVKQSSCVDRHRRITSCPPGCLMESVAPAFGRCSSKMN